MLGRMLSRRSFLHWSLLGPLSGSLMEPQFRLTRQQDHNGERDETLTKGRPTEVESLATAIVMKQDNLFFLARPDGNVPMTGNHGMGLYFHDCRYLNGYELTIAGKAPALLSASAAQGSVGIFTLTNPPLHFQDKMSLDEEELSITWHRQLDSERVALLDELKFENFTLNSVQFPLSLTFRSAFEDLYTVRGLEKQEYGHVRQPRWEDEKLIL